MGSAGTVTWATRPLAVGSPPVPLEAPQSFLASCALRWLAMPSSRSCCRQALFTVRVEAQCHNSKSSCHTRPCGVPQRRAAFRACAGEYARASGA